VGKGRTAKTRTGDSMKNIILAAALLFPIHSFAEEAASPVTPTQTESVAPTSSTATATRPETESASASPVSTYKTNYFAINNWPWNKAAQAKFQLSMKFSVLKPDLYIFNRNYFPAYVAYTQKSLWNIGQPSAPFEESNYNPEVFLEYPVNRRLGGKIYLRSVTVGLFEHESNGMAGIQSRSWNRQYIAAKFGLAGDKKFDVTNSFIQDKAALYLKLWIPSGYSEQDEYLQSVGKDTRFLDYMGRGELGLSVRNFLWGGVMKDHQLDVRLPIFHDTDKPSCQLEFRQQLPNMNFAIYLQYWYGYGETLLRFDQFGHRGFAGLSFSY